VRGLLRAVQPLRHLVLVHAFFSAHRIEHYRLDRGAAVYDDKV
jgi:hypothetical protein